MILKNDKKTDKEIDIDNAIDKDIGNAIDTGYANDFTIAFDFCLGNTHWTLAISSTNNF